MVRRRSIIALIVGSVALAMPAVGASDAESQLVGYVNQERSSRGLSTLAIHADLVEAARRHSASMARDGRIYHNPNLEHDVSGWKTVAENVASGGSAKDIHRALMESDTHRYNILYPAMQHIGIGVAWSGGKMFVTQIFREPFRSWSPPPRTTSTPTVAVTSAPASAPAPKPQAEPTPRTVKMLIQIVGIS